MAEVRARLIDRIKRTATIESFRFSLQAKVSFAPGQFLQVIFDEDKRDDKELNKYLSLSCSPNRDYIEFTKRLSASRFSEKLRNLKPDDEVLIKMPMGTCIFERSYKKIGFLIGGIGITPVISIIEYVNEEKLDTDIVLFYSNRTEEEIAFRTELDHWQSMNKNIKIYYTLTDCQPKDKKCFYGHIDKNMLQKQTCGIEDRILFIYGPPRMVEALSLTASELGCKKQNIKTERFMGY